jgi:CRISPR system Cascade subunit CasA
LNLIEEPWLPCLMSEGATTELSLADTLLQAHQIREIFDESPLVTVALHRLLLAILHRNFGPSGKKEWLELWRRGQWPERTLREYFTRWQERFELFHPERPFYQVPEMKGVGRQPVAVLFQEMAAGNNATLFDHSYENLPCAIPPARAARGLVARQAYSIGFGKSSPFYFSDSPLLRGFTVLVTGDNLFQTLVLNLVRYDEDHPFSGVGNHEDLPIWEQEHPATPRKQGNLPAGYLDYLTWQSRRIHLYPERDGDNIRFCQLQQNLKFTDDIRLEQIEQFKCNRKDVKRGWIPLSFREDKALWRDSHTLMEVGDSQKRPGVFNWIAEMAETAGAREAGVGPYFSFSAFGLATDTGKAASVTFWRHERLPLAVAYLSDASLRGWIAHSINYAEEVASDLRDSIWVLAHVMFQSLEANDYQGRSDDANRLAAQIAPLRLYWPMLEASFIELMGILPEMPPEDRQTRIFEWRKLVRNVARKAIEQTTREFYSDARELRAAAEGERVFRRKLRERLEVGEQP